ncbi:MAG: division plane positioning ATPase MipZ [Alphaproteobacteria bacterium]
MDTSPQSSPKPYVLVVGNEKGGTGKSTLAMHLITALLHDGFSVGSVDIDARQGTLSRYVENRQIYIKQHGKELPIPTHVRLMRSALPDQHAAEAEDRENLSKIFEDLAHCQFIVLDTPGSDTFLSRQAHSYADILITPLNDSFIDLDLLVRLESSPDNMVRPSTYAEMVWEQRKQRAIRDGGTIDWIVVRNRLSSTRTRNRDQMDQVLGLLSKRIGFRLGGGFGERVIFKELFLSGLTLVDLDKAGTTLTISHVTARQELRFLMSMLPLSPDQLSKTA